MTCCAARRRFSSNQVRPASFPAGPWESLESLYMLVTRRGRNPTSSFRVVERRTGIACETAPRLNIALPSPPGANGRPITGRAPKLSCSATSYFWPCWVEPHRCSFRSAARPEIFKEGASACAHSRAAALHWTNTCTLFVSLSLACRFFFHCL